ncbi:alpha/beta hydrolase family protein [Nocardia sp. bgisy134]|uniref:alpha/beta hydrolase family protein n=1 Tax=Nocardia sp. bgisy134 TaxID=3413789 RepID=UPI003D733C29
MASTTSRARRLFVSTLALTGTTERAANRFGTAPFLPALFADRLTHLGGIDPAVFSAQLAACNSFDDNRWTTHWETFADEHTATADAALAVLGGPSTRELLDSTTDVEVRKLGELLAPAVEILADRGPIAPPDAVDRFCALHPEDCDAAVALDALIKVVVYEFAASWPGWSPRRLQAYETSHRLCEILLTALAPAMGITVEAVRIPRGSADEVRGYLISPEGAEQLPTVLITNGLEGTLGELTLPLLQHRAEGMTYFVMEMPGTFHYRQPLTPESERVYSAVVDFLTADHRVDAQRIGMLGVSFGAYWSTRMAAVEPRLRAAVANGALADRTFAPTGSIGVPEIIVSTIRRTVGATSVPDMVGKLSALSLRDHLRRIEIPLLVVNGADDSLCRVEDSIDIATYAPNAQLVLYADDDHCAMKHEPEWLDLCIRFFRTHLAAAQN